MLEDPGIDGKVNAFSLEGTGRSGRKGKRMNALHMDVFRYNVL
jgi:hypothetical protein